VELARHQVGMVALAAGGDFDLIGVPIFLALK
jgi:hypothetical protein